MGRIVISFIFKKKPIHIECFNQSQNLAEIYPIKKAFHYVPDWWKKLDKSFYVHNVLTEMPWEKPTLRSCAGFIELYRNGLIMPMWADFDLFVDLDCYKFHSPYEKFKVHNHNSQEHNYALDGYHHLKILSPWLFRERTGVKFLWVPCSWSHLTDAPNLRFVPAAVDYKHQYTTNLNCFVPKSKTQFRVESGTPIAQIIPMSDRPIKITTHVIDEVEWIKLSSRMTFHKFTNGYFVAKKNIKMWGSKKD